MECGGLPPLWLRELAPGLVSGKQACRSKAKASFRNPKEKPRTKKVVSSDSAEFQKNNHSHHGNAQQDMLFNGIV
jgi:hypothetical protein